MNENFVYFSNLKRKEKNVMFGFWYAILIFKKINNI